MKILEVINQYIAEGDRLEKEYDRIQNNLKTNSSQENMTDMIMVMEDITKHNAEFRKLVKGMRDEEV